MSGRGVVDLVSKIGEMQTVSQQERRNAGYRRKPDPLSPALEAAEDEVFVLAKRTAHDSTPLVLVVLGLWGAD